jgi:hypothetical protein
MTQRWHEWRNMESTTCPSFGHVFITAPAWSATTGGQVPNGGTIFGNSNVHGNEYLGAEVILHGRMNVYDYTQLSDYFGYGANSFGHRGIATNSAFNGELPVPPGEVGLLTFDLPTWAAVEGYIDKPDGIVPTFIPGDGLYHFGSLQTCGMPQWELTSAIGPNILFDDTGVLYMLAAIPELKRVFVGRGTTFMMDPLT